MNKKNLFYIVSIVGFFTPYILKFLLSSSSDEIKIFAIYSLGKFNLIYFAIVIILFFMGLTKKFKNFAQTTQIIFVFLYFAYILSNYFIISKIKVENYIKSHNLNAQIIKISDLKKYPNFKIYYKSGNYAAVKILPKKKNTLPFNYRKDRAR